MTSRDDQLWAEVKGLRDEGLSVRAIAKVLGISRMTAHRLLWAPPPRDEFGDEDREVFDPDDPALLVPPFRFVRIEPEPPCRGSPVYQDYRGRYCDDLALYRRRESEGHREAPPGAPELPGLDEQIAAAGLSRVRRDDHWWWFYEDRLPAGARPYVDPRLSWPLPPTGQPWADPNPVIPEYEIGH